MGHRGRRDLDVLADHDGAGTRIDDDLGNSLARVDLQVFKDRQVVHTLSRVHRRADAHRAAIHGLGHAWAQQFVDLVDDTLGGGEVGPVEVQRQAIALVETTRYCTLHRSATRDTACRRNVDGDLRAIAAFGIEAADHQVALGDRIDVAVDTLERRHQQAAAAQALGVADRGHGNVHHLAGLGEWRQVGMHRHRSDVFQLHVAGAGGHFDAELRQHVVERLQGEWRLGGLVTRAVEPHHQAVTDQLVGTHARDTGDVLQALGMGAERTGQKQGCGNQLPDVEHVHPYSEGPKRAEEETVQPTRLAGVGEGTGTRIGDARIGHTGGRHCVVGGDVVGADQAGDAHQLFAGVQGHPLLTTHGDDAVGQHFSDGDGDRTRQRIALGGLTVALGGTLTAVARFQR
ncbi:hypothetical protein D3C78_961500 [compost metagenome]